MTLIADTKSNLQRYLEVLEKELTKITMNINTKKTYEINVDVKRIEQGAWQTYYEQLRQNGKLDRTINEIIGSTGSKFLIKSTFLQNNSENWSCKEIVCPTTIYYMMRYGQRQRVKNLKSMKNRKQNQTRLRAWWIHGIREKMNDMGRNIKSNPG